MKTTTAQLEKKPFQQEDAEGTEAASRSHRSLTPVGSCASLNLVATDVSPRMIPKTKVSTDSRQRLRSERIEMCALLGWRSSGSLVLLLMLLLGGLTAFTPRVPAQPAVQAWVQRYSHATDSDDQAQKVVTDNAGNVIVAGYTDDGITGADMLVIKYSGAGAPLWTNRYNGPANFDDVAQAVAVDGSANVFVAGYTEEGITGQDMLVIKYSGAGVPLWTNRYNGPLTSPDQAQAVAVDGSGNVFVTGYSAGIGSSDDYATIKYSSAGVPLWTNRYNGGNSDRAYAAAVDGSGNVFVTGYSIGSGSSYDYATIAYSGAGVPLWTNRYNGPGNSSDEAQAVAVDGSGNVFVTGYSIDSSGHHDYATIAYSGAGVPLWTNRYNGPGNANDAAYAVVVDGSGNVFVTGRSASTNVSPYTYDYATIGYSGAGVPLWTNRYDGPGNSSDYAQAVAVDSSGNVFVTGYSVGSGSTNDYATIAYSGAGVPLWTNRYNGPGNSTDYAQAVAVDGSGNLFVTGSSTGSGSLADYATIKYSGAGVPLWTNRYNGPGNSIDQAQAVAVDGNGNVFVTGSSPGSGSGTDYATIGYSGAGVPLWTNRYNGPRNSVDFAQAVAVDSSGNVFVTGYSIDSSSYVDYATIGYSGAGVPLWTNRYNGLGNFYDAARAVAVDGSGNVFVTGESWSGSSYDYATIAYSSAGVPLWTNRYNGPGNSSDQARAVVVDGNGNVFVTGYSWSGSGAFDYATIEYSGAGVPLWTNRYNGPGNSSDYAYAMAVDSSGNVFVTGNSVGSGSTNDYATIAYSGAGVPLWTNRYNGPGNSSDEAQAVAVDGSGNVFVTGYSSSGSSFDYATIAYSGAGVPLWTNRYNGPGNSDDRAYAAAVDGSGNVFVTGYSIGSGSSYDYATIAYSGAGVPLWTDRYNGPANGDDSPQTKQSLALGPDGSVYVTGSSDRDIGRGASDFATIKYVTVPVLTIERDGNGGFFISVNGAPNATYRLQRAPSVTGPWSASAPQTAPASGVVVFWDLFPLPGQGFYRTVQP